MHTETATCVHSHTCTSTHAQLHMCTTTHTEAVTCMHNHTCTATHVYSHTCTQDSNMPTRSHRATCMHTATHTHGHTDVCSSARILPSVSSCAHVCSSCPWQGPAEGSVGLSTPGPGSVAAVACPLCSRDMAVAGSGTPGACPWRVTVPALRWQRCHRSGVPGFVVSASAGVCVKGWWVGNGGACPARVICQHTHLHAHTDTASCAHTCVHILSCSCAQCHTCVCAGLMHTRVHTGCPAQAHTPPRVSVQQQHIWPL